MNYCRRHPETAQLIMQSLCIVWQLLVLATMHMEVFLRQVASAKVVIYTWAIDCQYIRIGMMKILHAACHLLHQRQIMIDTLWAFHHRLYRLIITKNTNLRHIIVQCHQALGRFDCRKKFKKKKLKAITYLS